MSETTHDLADRFGEPRYVLLTTLRRPREGETAGRPVATPVWVVRDGDELLVFTHGDLGKTKRIRHTPTVTLQACSARGRVKHGAALYSGEAVVRDDPDSMARLEKAMRRKYGLQYPIARRMAGLSKSAGPEVALIVRLVA